ncbi:MAG: pyruvate:ferredoxin (flavodoxin) oxidoreductase [Acidimicrobiia bacterium]|nr:pyruvate:ferredoxin (flavodoxin) oxidoreductase [Acidimicrobiia bacterium]
MADPAHISVDGNEAAARIAHRVSEVIAIYPITPASPMGELADAWSQAGVCNVWGAVPEVIEMQSEAGAAGAVHGALQTGALTTTFTASQGLLLMIPNLYKIAGQLLASVIHVAARSVATHALSIFGDHSDVMAARQTGMAMLASGSVQEAQDLALIAHAATLRSRVPFLHFFDGFRTSHEVAKIEVVDDEVIRSMIDDDLVVAHRLRALDPDQPVLRGTAQNPDVFFQAREAANPHHLAVPDVVRAEMERFAELTGRRYDLFEYHGHPDAERVIVIMGSGAGTVCEAVDAMVAAGERVGVVTVRLYRPFDVAALVDVLPATTERIAVLDRTKEPGSAGEPLYLDVVAALAQRWTGPSPSEGAPSPVPTVIGGRYGLSSKEFTPAMVLGVFGELESESPRREVTIGIVDDVTDTSIAHDADAWHEPDSVTRAVFYGLGSDGTVGANKNSVKIIGELTPLYAQGYFVYDSKKSGSTTVSHLRFGPDPIRSAYLVQEADFVAIHHFGSFERQDLLGIAARGATLLINSPFPAGETWEHLPAEVQRTIIEKQLVAWVVDGGSVAREHGLGNRINTVLQTCFFSLSGLLPADRAAEAIKASIAKTYGKRGEIVLQRNFSAVDASVAALRRMTVPDRATSTRNRPAPVPPAAPDFVQRVTARMIEGEGDLLPVSAFPIDGTFPMGTTRWEKRSIAAEIPIWDPEICIDCARCALVCPHAAIRLKVLPEAELAGAPSSFRHRPWKDRSDPTMRAIIQVAPDDCTGCGVCVSICPAKSKEVVKHKSINMEAKADHLDVERVNFDYFLSLPEHDRSLLKLDTVKGSQMAQPLFEFSGACAGCGETPYLKLLTQQMGDRMVVANATGCSSIYGGNLPTTPWAVDAEGRGPAWANSLFEDNAEFGLGMRLALDHHEAAARHLLSELAPRVGPIAIEILENDKGDEAAIARQREQVAELREWLESNPDVLTRRLTSLAHHLIKRSVWSIGGDGWAYDIGFGGVDHVLASGRDVNILVLDTEVYSNTGGQTSKATPRAAIAKFSAGGKTTAKKDIGMIAMAYGDVYVAHIAMGANMTQTVKALTEAAAHPGPSLVIAYSPCIAHGIDMADMMGHQKMAAASGYWPLYRYDPRREAAGDHGLHLDSSKPKIPFKEFAMTEARFSMLTRANPEVADELMTLAQADIDDRWHLYEQMVEVERTARYGILEEEEDE